MIPKFTIQLNLFNKLKIIFDFNLITIPTVEDFNYDTVYLFIHPSVFSSRMLHLCESTLSNLETIYNNRQRKLWN